MLGFSEERERGLEVLFRVLGEESEREVEINESFFCTRYLFTNATHVDVANFKVELITSRIETSKLHSVLWAQL